MAVERAGLALATARREVTSRILAERGAGMGAVEAWIAGRERGLAELREVVAASAATGMTASQAIVAASLAARVAGTSAWDEAS